MIGVTGTDGKTTTCHLLHSILKRVNNIKAGYISTISADFGDETVSDWIACHDPRRAAAYKPTWRAWSKRA